MKGLLRKAIAECLGTFTLVFAACGVAALTGGNDLVGISLAFGLVIVAMAYSIGNVSGCHINPAVSLGCLITKRMTVVEFFVYVAAQIVGGFLGALALFGLAKAVGMDFTANALACNFVMGGEMKAGPVIGSLLVEAVLTCIFVFVILNVTAADSKVGDKAGVLIGLTLTLVHLVGIPFTGTSVNPARSLATALGSLIFGGFNAEGALQQVWIFVVGPLVGALLAALLYKLLHKEEKAEEPKAE